MRHIGFGVAAAALVGCGGGPVVVRVHGTAEYGGKPIPVGRVYLDPTGPAAFDHPIAVARIENGKFDTDVEGRGARPGTYGVRVLGFDGKPTPDNPDGLPLFPDYKTTATVPPDGLELKIEVPAAGKK